jgi:hypothetical protein
MSIIASGTTSGTALVSTGDTNGNLVFQTNGTTTALTLSTAQLATFAGKASFPSTIGVGGATAAASGSGVSFPATQSASSDANTLDDYEEGTWTPNQGGGLTVVGTFSSAGFYTRVGNVVTVWGFLGGSTSIASSTTGILCTNLPFTGAPPSGNQFMPGPMVNASGNTVSSCVLVNTTTLYGIAAIAANSGICFSNTYRV